MQKASLPLGRSSGVAITIGNKGYTGLGGTNNFFDDEWWEYDPVANTWTQKANYGGGPVAYNVAFAIGNKGYVGTGMTPPGYGATNIFWEYDPTLNLWTQKANVGTATRNFADAFAVGGKGYVIAGTTGIGDKDVWEYDPVSDTWTQKANFGGGVRREHVSCVIGNKAYSGTGIGMPGIMKDWWEYDPASDAWTQKANVPGAVRREATAFSVCDKGFVGLGGQYSGGIYMNDFWMYDPATNSWSAVSTFPAMKRAEAVAFVIGNKAYVGTGYDLNGTLYSDWWELSPATGFTVSATATTICSGENITLTASGATSYNWNTGSTSSSIVVSPAISSTYSVIMSNCFGTDTFSSSIVVHPKPNASFSSNFTFCDPQLQFTDNSSNASQWSWNFSDGNTSFAQHPSHVYSAEGNYPVTLVTTSSFGCADTAQQNFDVKGLEAMFIPNAFSPNGDEENDVLNVYGDCIKEMHLAVYNRYGQKVFESYEQKKGWDGKYKGTLEGSQVFTYYFDATLLTEEIIKRTGNISLVR